MYIYIHVFIYREIDGERATNNHRCQLCCLSHLFGDVYSVTSKLFTQAKHCQFIRRPEYMYGISNIVGIIGST